MRPALAPLVLTLVVTAVSLPRSTVPTPPRTLDDVHADYLEDEGTGRRLADLHVRIVADGDGPRLRLRVSATGPRVDPAPGYRGVFGANHVTARELTAAWQESRLRFVVRTPSTHGNRTGTITPQSWGTVPERELRPGGALDLDARSLERYLLAIECTSPPLAPGEHDAYLELGGVPRLRVAIRIDAHRTGSARIEAIESLGEHRIEVLR